MVQRPLMHRGTVADSIAPRCCPPGTLQSLTVRMSRHQAGKLSGRVPVWPLIGCNTQWLLKESDPESAPCFFLVFT